MNAEKWQLFLAELPWAERLGRAWVRRRALRRGAYEDEAEQAARIGLWQSVLRYDSARGDFRSFAYPRVKGEILEWARSDGPYRVRGGRHNYGMPRVLPLTECAQSRAPIGSSAALVDVSDELRALLRLVPDARDRMLIIARYGGSQTECEAARTAGINVSQPAASKRIRRAVTTIRSAAGITVKSLRHCHANNWSGNACACGADLARGSAHGQCRRCYQRNWARAAGRPEVRAARRRMELA